MHSQEAGAARSMEGEITACEIAGKNNENKVLKRLR